MAISGDTLAVGAQADDTAARGGGAVYVFVKQGNRFGFAAALTDDALVISAAFDSSGPRNSGATYSFR